MIRKRADEVEWLEFTLLSEIPGLYHAVFLRHGGVSVGAYTSLNVGERVGDEPAFVTRNREIIQETSQAKHIATGNQVHGVVISEVKGKNDAEKAGCDGLITQEREVALMIKHADCQAILIYDPIHHACANLHAGWRGIVQNILAVGIAAMQKTYHSHPEDLLVCISPSLGVDHSEFKNYREEIPEKFWQFQVKPTYFNLQEMSRSLLLEAGILPDHIEISNICTACNPDDFFSFRRDKVTGRHGTMIYLR